MPRKPFFRSKVTGRFISEDEAREEDSLVYTRAPGDAFYTPTPSYEYFAPPEEVSEAEPFWQTRDDDRLHWWENFDHTADQDVSMFAPPEGMASFRVFFDVVDNPDYPRGVISSTWHDIADWPPTLDMVRNGEPVGFHSIKFDRR